MTTEDRSASAGTTGTTGTTDTTDTTDTANPEMGTAGRTGTASKGSAIRNAFIWHMRTMGSTALWFLGTMVLIVTLIDVGFAAFASTPLLAVAEPLLYPSIIASSSLIFLLVMGIVMPGYLESMLSFGLTRQQHALALLLCGLAVTGGLALICVLLALPLSQFDLLQSIRFSLLFIYSWLFFLVGWLIAIGYQHRRFITAFLSTLLGVAILVFGPFWNEWLRMLSPLAVDDTSGLHLQQLLQAVEFGDADLGILSLAGTTVLIIILMPTVIALTRHIPIKV